ncbi:hypothetical protein E2C01_058842 [Portunus trituberculatus]|uniref:Uncharacterized protein n=1 Tax=Portunus trituberculatus TaxID=210409 RepID=A0A5B7H0X6_PORTR|nr:hypothetical protein [Portunus trituberculatus]
MMERSLKSASPLPPESQDSQRTPPPLPQMETQLSPTTGPPPARSSRVYTIEDILGRPQPQESSAPQVNAVDSQLAGVLSSGGQEEAPPGDLPVTSQTRGRDRILRRGQLVRSMIEATTIPRRRPQRHALLVWFISDVSPSDSISQEHETLYETLGHNNFFS